jgi:hypothetical protein
MWMQVSSLPTNSSLQNTPRYQFSLKSESIDKMTAIANQRWISIRNIIIYLETKFRPNERIFVFWGPFWIPNGRYSKPTWSPYGAACLTSCKYPFPLKSFHFWIFTDFLIFYIGGRFEMVAILKIPRPECTNLPYRVVGPCRLSISVNISILQDSCKILIYSRFCF